MMRRLACALAFLALCAPSQARAAERDARPIVRTEVRPDSVVVGAPIRLLVTVLVPTWFTHAPDYPDFELPGLVVRLPPDSSNNIQETISGIAYSGIVREYVLHPQRDADYVLDDRIVRVHFANPETRRSIDAEIPLEPIRFRGIIPPSAADLDPFVATDRLTLEQTIDGDSSSLRVGDAIRRTVSIRANDLPALFLPPILEDEPRIPGLRTYLRDPVVADLPGETAERSIGTRMETVTYVIEEPGVYSLPAATLRWWNRRTGSIETAITDRLVFRVATEERPGSDVDSPVGWRDTAIRDLTALLVACLVIFPIGWQSRKRLGRLVSRSRSWAGRLADSEPVRFRRLLRSVNRGDPRTIQSDLDAWLESIGLRPPTLPSSKREKDFELLIQAMKPVERRLFVETTGISDAPLVEPRTFRRALRRARRKLLETNIERDSPDSLPPLNPR